MFKSGVSTVGIAVTVTLALAVTSIHGVAQAPEPRRGGPRDWSHGRVIASRFGPDLDRNIALNWRTVMKHAQLDNARALRQPRIDWFDAMQQIAKRKVVRPPATAHLDWNLLTGGYGPVVGYPAKTSFSISANSCSDVIYFTVDQPGAASTVNVVAITDAYGICPSNSTGTTPTVKFGLRLPFGAPTSPVPSLDGNILYVIESRSSANGGPILHAINVNSTSIASTKGTYTFGTTVWSNAHVLRTSPTGAAMTNDQLFQITFAGVANTLSSPYLDYDTNQLFFGDSAGWVHRVRNVHLTTAAESAPFPIRCGTRALQSPVFVKDQVIVSSTDGKLYRIDTTAGTPVCIGSVQGGSGTGVGGGFSAPVVDVTNDRILVISNDANGFGLRGVGAIALKFASGAQQLSGQSLGDGSTTIAPMPPAFDDEFWSTGNGNLYAAGAPNSGNGTYLIKVPYNGTLGTPSGFARLHNTGTETVATSPVTEFLTASSLSQPDFVFIGGGSGNYRYMNRISADFGGSDGSPVSMSNSFNPIGSGGVISGIIIDTRTSGVIGATATANIYFGTVGVGPSTSQSAIIQLAQQF